MKKLSLLLPVFAGILFGSAGIFVRKLSAFEFDNPTILCSRTIFAVLEMLILILVAGKKYLKIKVRDIPVFLGTGTVGMLGANLFYNVTVKNLTLALAAVLMSMAPIFVLIVASFLFHEKITKRKTGCTVMAIAGCVLASGLLEQSGFLQSSGLGIVTGVASAFFYALYSIFSRIATDRGYQTYTVIFYSVLFITIVMLPFSDLSKISGMLAAAPASNLVLLLLHALCTSVLPYVFLTLSLRYAEAGKVSILASGAEPASAIIFGIFIYAEIPSILMLVGLAVVILALALLCKKTRVQPNRESFYSPGKR